jgi:hypothetical protein
MDLIKNALWVIGDSFCQDGVGHDGTQCRWSEYVRAYFKSKYLMNQFKIRYYNYAEGSCDTQTIIDNWIKLIPNMKEDDVIIVCLSDISRNRFPLKMQNIRILPKDLNSDEYKFNSPPTINSYFMYAPVGWNPSNPLMPSGDDTDVEISPADKFRDYSWDTNILLNTEAYNNSKIDIIEALYKITPCKKKFIYTWIDTDRLNSKNIHSKKWITENLFDGKWETQHQSWLSSLGKIGNKDDGHLSNMCEKLMADYFIKKFEF